MTNQPIQENKISFEEWMNKLRDYVENHPRLGKRGKAFYRPIVAKDNQECWKDYYDGGYTPEDALTEDMSYLD